MKQSKLFLLVISVSLSFALNALAQTTWNGAGGNGSWNNPANWNPSGIPTGGNLVFDGNTQTTISFNYTENQSYGVFTFNPTAGAFIINASGTSNQIRPTNFVDNSTNTQTINLKIDLTAQRSISVVPGGNLDFTATILGAAGFGLNIAASGGTVTLGGNNTYLGLTAVSSGTVIVAGALSGTSTVGNTAILDVNGSSNSPITVNTGGTMEGQGTVDTVSLTSSSNEALSPGLAATNSVVGTLTATNGVTLPTAFATNFNVRLGVVTGTDHDELAVSSGPITLGTASDLNLTLGSAFLSSSTVGTFYNIIVGGAGSTGTVSDDFANAVPNGSGIGTIVDGNDTFSVIYGSDGTTDGTGLVGNDVTLELTAVPEPATWATLLGGIGLLGVYQRKRARRS